jgi:hypothetical protein
MRVGCVEAVPSKNLVHWRDSYPLIRSVWSTGPCTGVWVISSTPLLTGGLIYVGSNHCPAGSTGVSSGPAHQAHVVLLTINTTL